MAKLTLGLRKLGYEDLESIAVLDKQNATNTTSNTTTPRNSSSGGGGGEIGEGSSSSSSIHDDGGGSVTRVVARRLLRDMRATSERYVVVAAAGAVDAGSEVMARNRAASGGGGGSDSRSVQRNGRGEHSSGSSSSVSSSRGSVRGGAGGRASAGAVLEGGWGGLTFAGFMAWSSVHGGRLMLLKDLVYACLAEFGMRPAKAVQEREVIQEIFRRCASWRGGGGRARDRCLQPCFLLLFFLFDWVIFSHRGYHIVLVGGSRGLDGRLAR